MYICVYVCIHVCCVTADELKVVKCLRAYKYFAEVQTLNPFLLNISPTFSSPCYVYTCSDVCTRKYMSWAYTAFRNRICLIDDLTGCCLLLGPIRSPLLPNVRGGGRVLSASSLRSIILKNISEVTGDRAFRRGEGGRSNLSPPLPAYAHACVLLVCMYYTFPPHRYQYYMGLHSGSQHG